MWTRPEWRGGCAYEGGVELAVGSPAKSATVQPAVAVGVTTAAAAAAGCCAGVASAVLVCGGLRCRCPFCLEAMKPSTPLQRLAEPVVCCFAVLRHVPGTVRGAGDLDSADFHWRRAAFLPNAAGAGSLLPVLLKSL